MSPQDALGQERMAAIETVRSWLVAEKLLTDDAQTTDVTLMTIPPSKVAEWRRSAARDSERWVYAQKDDGSFVAVDEPSDLAFTEVASAVVYPELHTRVVAWWLVHAWRLIDLVQAALRDVEEWRITVAAVSCRAALEEVGCLLYEARALTDAWAVAKATPGATSLEGADAVRRTLRPVLNKVTLGSRMKAVTHPDLQAVNVMTYIQKLAKLLRNPAVEDWYEWLSDAAHPALGARIALASQPVVHESGAVMLRFYSRRPVPPRDLKGAVRGTDFTIAHKATDALIFSAQVGEWLLAHSLQVVDDIGLTTGAATLTSRRYWRDLTPVRGARRCPCGRGRASDCGHRWGAPAPTLVIPSGI